jgi:hypothetical protein
VRKPSCVFCLCLFVLTASSARAAEWQFTGMAGFTFVGRTTLVDPDNAASSLHVNLGGAATFLTNGIIGAEGLATWTPRFLKSGASGLVVGGRSEALMGNLVLTTPRRLTEYTLRPFVSGGVGLLRASMQDQPPIFAYRANLTGLDIGGGAIGFLSNNIGLRFDVRYFSTLNRTDNVIAFGKTHLSYVTASVGIVYRR